MAELKTKKTAASVATFLDSVADAGKRADSNELCRLLQRVTGEKPAMWGTSIVGFGEGRFRYASGREGDWFIAVFSPRAQKLTVYVMSGFSTMKPLLTKLGKHSTGSSCLYLGKLADVDRKVLEAILRQGIEETRAVIRPRSAEPAKVKARPSQPQADASSSRGKAASSRAHSRKGAARTRAGKEKTRQ